MNYELAKELKDAGYNHGRFQLYGPKDFANRFPTLEELIEACGTSFMSLSAYKESVGYEQHEAIESWSAIGAKTVCKVGKGKIPTEAVARLWIALQAKK